MLTAFVYFFFVFLLYITSKYAFWICLFKILCIPFCTLTMALPVVDYIAYGFGYGRHKQDNLQNGIDCQKHLRSSYNNFQSSSRSTSSKNQLLSQLHTLMNTNQDTFAFVCFRDSALLLHTFY